MSRFRPRISLLSALLLTTIAATAIVIVLLWREVDPLRQQVSGLRQELGYLSVRDENMIYAMEVPTIEPGTWRFRVYLPKNKAFRIHDRLHTIPGKVPKMTRKEWLACLLETRSGSSSTIDSGEFTIDVHVRRNPAEENHWDFEYTTYRDGVTWKGGIGTTMPWLNDRRAWSTSSEAGLRQQVERDPADGIVLFALRKGIVKEMNGGYSKTSPDVSVENPGIMMWIAPVSASE